MTRAEFERQVAAALDYYEKAGIVLSEEEKKNIEVCDHGIGIVEKVGLQLLTYINTDRVCAKEMVLTPGQTCPEHKHVPTNGCEGKEETFRCRYGKVYLYTDSGKGGKKENIHTSLPPTDVTFFDETILLPGEQFTILPETW